jgi:hypothetical protein
MITFCQNIATKVLRCLGFIGKNETALPAEGGIVCIIIALLSLSILSVVLH